jgi:hypothetical protein
MTTLTKNYGQVQSGEISGNYVSPKARRVTLAQRYDNFIEGLTFSHFGLISIAILFGSCLGAITAMYLFLYGAPMWLFSIGLFSSLANLVACIGQAPTKWVVNMFAQSLIVNVGLLIVSFFL